MEKVGEGSWGGEGGLEGANRPVVGGAEEEALGTESNPRQYSPKNLKPQSYNHKQLNSVKSHENLEEDPIFQMRPQPSQHLDFSLVRP